ncbi:hypothetical protein [Niveibacterium sp. COAC-50]|uniref:hypothetical protein n=1 Tax=Niveibacterium sp. COAC-50 TaxID=2729384 RepID=UPI0015528E8D|nr:hypothetical protein [Niveibacterium sp. COAC-50]
MFKQFVAAAATFFGLSLTAAAGNATVFGQEIGVTTYQTVADQLGRATPLRDAGTNAYSKGRMLESDGSGLNIEGLSKVLFIFDTQDKLVATLLTLPKGPMNDNVAPTISMLKRKYRAVRIQQPFVGDVEARFEQGSSVVALNAPHMSFDMNVTYMTRQFEQSYLSAQRAETERQKRHREASF